MMRKTDLLVLAAVLSVAVPAAAQPSREQLRASVREAAENFRTVYYQRGREEQSDRQTRTLKLGATGELSLSNIAGDITVSKANGNDTTIEIVKTARARSADEAKAQLGMVNVTINERSGRAEVKAEYPQNDQSGWGWGRRGMNVSVAYTVSAPTGTRLTINSVSGSIRVSDVKGDLSVNTISGGVRLANAGRIASAKSVSGNVEILDTQIDGGLEAQSVSGNVILRKVAARRVNVGSVSGTVQVEDVQCDRVEAHSISGDVQYGGTLAKGGRYELTSHSGSVRVDVEGNTGFELEANSFSGSVRSDLPLTNSSSGGGERGPMRRRALRGVYGDGSAVLNVTTFSGSVVIAKR
jgi:DUF4097 and DUF4098 domain-containing protein YvlB